MVLIDANIQEEVQAAQSKADFIAKMSIASKEARETKDDIVSEAKNAAKT